MSLKEVIKCLSICHCRWVLKSKCCENSECMSDIEEGPSPINSPKQNKKEVII